MEPTQQDPEPQQPQDLITDYHSDIRQIEIEGYELVVKKARNALFWAGGLIFFWEMVSMFRDIGDFYWPIMVWAIIEGGVFIALALYTKKKPYTAIILGLIAFIGFIVFVAVVLGYTEGGLGVVKAIFSGIIVKVLILVALIRPLKDAKELQQIKEEQKKL